MKRKKNTKRLGFCRTSFIKKKGLLINGVPLSSSNLLTVNVAINGDLNQSGKSHRRNSSINTKDISESRMTTFSIDKKIQKISNDSNNDDDSSKIEHNIYDNSSSSPIINILKKS
jgi:hypothetical protein